MARIANYSGRMTKRRRQEPGWIRYTTRQNSPAPAPPPCPLTLVDDSITEGRLVIHNAPADGQVLAYDLPNTRMEWITPAAGGASDGVLSGLALANDGTVTATLTVRART